MAAMILYPALLIRSYEKDGCKFKPIQRASTLCRVGLASFFITVVLNHSGADAGAFFHLLVGVTTTFYMIIEGAAEGRRDLCKDIRYPLCLRCDGSHFTGTFLDIFVFTFFGIELCLYEAL